MRLLIISDMAHYERAGRIAGWGPTVQEIDHLAQLFDEVSHVAFLHSKEAPVSALPYSADNLRFVPVPPAGGARFADKLEILRLYPLYARTILTELRRADVVHVRCPASISLLAVVLLSLVRHPEKRWIKYAGSWQAYEGEAWSYALQRWWLRRGWAKAVVTVNGQWPDQPEHVRAFLNPCLTEEELRRGRTLACKKQLDGTMRLLFIGSLIRAKGGARALHVMQKLRQQGLPVVLDVVGDGPERATLEAQADALEVSEQVTFHGWIPRTELESFYGRAHVMLFPSRNEGWPKVLSEGMAHGVVPVASNVSSIPQYLERFGTGCVFDSEDLDAFVQAIARYAAHPDVWRGEALRGIEAAVHFSYARYLQAVQCLLEEGQLRADEAVRGATSGR